MKKPMNYIQKVNLIFFASLLSIAVLAASLIISLPRQAHAAPLASGATLSYVEVQAEDAATNGTIIGPDRSYPSLAGEAIERKAVTLDAEGEYVEFTVPESANSIVMRYSIPDSIDGLGLTAPLSLYINGSQQPDLTLTSKYAWYYGDYPFTNNPAQIRPHHFYDEIHLLTSQLSPGDTVKVQMDASSTAPSYTIDLIDFEQVAGALSQPVDSLSLTVDYSADPTGVADATTALQTAVNAASAQGKVLWIPEGTYKLTDQINIPNNVTIQGAGMWYSTLHFVNQSGNSAGLFGAFPSTNFHAADFAIQGEVQQRDDNDQMNGFGGGFSNSTITRVWLEHLKVGAWLDGPFTNLVMSNLIIRNMTADGVNFHQAVTNSSVTQSLIRNTGDDGLAMWTHNVNDVNNTFSFNRVEMPVLANGIAIYGGKNNNVTDNYVGDQQTAGGGIHVGNRFTSIPVSGTINILRNTIVRSGSQDYYNSWNFGTGALWFYSLEAPMSATINVNDNVLVDNNYEAFHFIGNNAITNVTFNNNQIIGAGTYGVESRMTSGSVTFTDTSVYGLGLGGYYQKPFLGDMNGDICTPPSSFMIVDGGGNGDLDLTNPTCVLPYPAPIYGVIPTATPTLTNTPCPGICPTNTPTLTPTPTEIPINYVRIKNKWQGTYLYEEAGTVKYGQPTSTDAYSHWVVEDFSGHQRIKNRATGNYMNIENLLTYVESGAVCDVCTSGQWDVSVAPDPSFYIIRSVYHPWQIINVENLTGYAQYGDIPTDWGSPQWAFETAPDPQPTPAATVYVRIKNKWQNQYLYEDSETVKYGAPASTDPTSHWVIEDYVGHQRIKNRATGNYMHIENLLAYVQTGQVCGPCTSGQWDVQDAPSVGYKIFRSVYHPWQIMNVEQQTGYAEYTADTTVPTANDSAQWLLEVAPDPVTPTPGPGSNLAQGKSIVDNGHTGGFVATNANDGNTSSYWEGLSYPNMLTVDLGSSQTVGSVRVRLNPNMIWEARTQNIEVLQSADNVNFTPLVAATNYGFDPNTGNQVLITFASTSTRYVRLAFTSNTGAPNGQAAEFEVYETVPGVPTATPTAIPVNYVRIKNKWQNTYLYEDASTVKYGLPADTDAASQWAIEDFAGHQRIRNRATGHYMAIEGLLAYVQSISVCDPCASYQWDVQDAPDAGFKIIRSVWHPWQIINVENQTGYAEYGDIPVAWGSPQWSFEAAPDPVTPTPTPTPVSYVRIKNRWQSTYLYEDANKVKYGTPADTDTTSQWVIEDFAGHQRIKNRSTGNYMNIENLLAYVESGSVCDVCTSGQWDVQDAPDAGFKILRSVYHPWQIMNVEHQTGYAEYSADWEVQVGWQSPQWSFEAVIDPVATLTPTPSATPLSYVRIKNKWQNTYLYEDTETVKYGAPDATDTTSQWAIEDFAGHQRIRNRATGHYMAIEGLLAYVQSISVCDPCASYQWDVQDAPDAGFKIIRSVWHPWQIINVEHLTSYAEYGDIPVAWGSPQWSFEVVTDPATPTDPAPTASATTPITATPSRTATKSPTPTRTATPTRTPAHVTVTLNSIAEQDGWVLESSENSNMGGTRNSSDAVFRVGDDAAKKQYRGILSFNTGSIPDNATITAVTLKVKQQSLVGGRNPYELFRGFMVDVKKGFFGSFAALLAGDFQAAASGTYGPASPAPVGNVYSFNLINAKANINKLATNGGLTQIRLRFKLDDSNDLVANYLKLYSGNAAAANRPQLIITYIVP